MLSLQVETGKSIIVMEILNNLLVTDVKRIRLLLYKLTYFRTLEHHIRNKVSHLIPEKINQEGQIFFLSGFGDQYSNTKLGS